MIPRSPGLSATLRRAVLDLGREWAASPDRPRPSADVAAHWDSVIASWAGDVGVPLLVRKHDRKDNRRGSALRHNSGRVLVPVDNAAANWCMANALLGRRPTLRELATALDEHRLPVAMILARGEGDGARCRGLFGRCDDTPDLNDLGWKVAHLRPVGLRQRAKLTEVPLADLQDHLRRLLSPSNMILVPKSHGALAEVPEFLAAFDGLVGEREQAEEQP